MIRLALVGTGGMAHTHARRFREIRGCNLVACADVVAGKAAAFAGKNSVPAAYDDPDEMLKTEKLDAVSIAELHCDLKTFDKGVREIGPYVLDANDAFVSSVRFKNGAVGTLHSSRWATGHVNTVGLRVHGDEGALELNLDRDPSDQLRVCIGPKARNSAKWEALRCPRTPDIYQRFVTAVRTGEACQTSFAVGAKVQACLEASLVSSREGKYVRVK